MTLVLTFLELRNFHLAKSGHVTMNVYGCVYVHTCALWRGYLICLGYCACGGMCCVSIYTAWTSVAVLFSKAMRRPQKRGTAKSKFRAFFMSIVCHINHHFANETSAFFIISRIILVL